jgi:hypothetical protein
MRRDYDAVRAALCFRWSNGQVEGQVHRIRYLKAEHGRAGEVRPAGSARVRPPRLELAGEELTATLALIRRQLAARPAALVGAAGGGARGAVGAVHERAARP